MSAGNNDPRLLYSIPNIRAYHLQNGAESELTPAGAQTLSLLMVPTTSPFAGLYTTDQQSDAPEDDFYLHLHLPPELDLPLPATTQIYHKPPHSYLIPRWDLGPETGAFTRIEFPGIGTGPNRVSQEDVDTFETILAQCTAFLERAPPPKYTGTSTPTQEKSGQGYKGYNPAEYGPGEGYVKPSEGFYAPGSENHGHIVLIDEENGSVVGELSEGFRVVEDSNLKAGSKSMSLIKTSRISCHRGVLTNSDPVEIQLPEDGSNNIGVRNAPPEYLKDALHPAYQNSSLVSNAALASRFIVTTSSLISNVLQSGADTFTQRTNPNPKPMTFTPTTHARVRKLNNLSQGAAGLSSKTVGQVTKYAQNIGASIARKGERQGRGMDRDGKPLESYKPGILNKSLMAFSTIADGIDQAGRNLLASGSTAASTIVGHRYGPEAGEVAKGVTGGFQNVGLVYIDAAGVSRRAIVKSVAKGMVVGKVKGGGNLVINNNESAVFTGIPQAWGEKGDGASALGAGNSTGRATPSGNENTFGSGPPPSYASRAGEHLAGYPSSGGTSGYPAEKQR
ncbi:MAG: hypothetical protein M1829_003411 [Trizodia sp. TS-e1964]|nr:MAG: hypothetical protein M1829_003411 [Trizodia sp. TS-e1964]